MTTFFQGQNATFFLNFTDEGGTPLTQGVSGVTVNMYHQIGSNRFVDIASGTMIQDPIEPNRFYYNYFFPSNAPTTDYITVYNSYYSGTLIQQTETHSVLPGSTTIPGSIATAGSILVSGTVIDGSGVGIANTQITATIGNILYGSTTTDSSGNYIVPIDPGYYLFLYTNTGYYPNQSFKTVPSGVNNYSFGNTLLNAQISGSLTLTDSVLAPSPLNPGANVPVPNIKITLFSIGSVPSSPVNYNVNYGSALQTVYTDSNGAWSMSANSGYYILDFEGMRYNPSTGKNERFKLTRNIEVNSMYPNNFNYLDSSKYQYV